MHSLQAVTDQKPTANEKQMQQRVDTSATETTIINILQSEFSISHACQFSLHMHGTSAVYTTKCYMFRGEEFLIGTVLYKTKSLDGTKPDTNPNPNTNPIKLFCAFYPASSHDLQTSLFC